MTPIGVDRTQAIGKKSTGGIFLSKLRICLLALMVLLVVNISCPVSAANTAGPNNAGTGADVTYGDTAWSYPGNITSAGSPYTTVDLHHGDDSHYLRGTNFGFAIPGNATINGITVTIRRQGEQTGGYGIADRHIYLVKNGVIQTSGNDRADTYSNWPDSMTAKSYGSSTDLWGLNWSAADINNQNFGVAISAHNNSSLYSHTASVDYLQISVTYTNNPGASTTTLSSSLNPAAYNQPVIFTAAVMPGGATGTIQFKMDGVNFGTPVTLANSSATSLSTSSLPVGNHDVSATYSGDALYLTSTGTLSGGQTVSKALAEVTLDNLDQTYDGNPRAVTASTVPPGLNVTLTYDGSSIPPSAAGSYAVTGTVSDSNYSGQAADTLFVAKAAQIITLDNLENKTYGDAPFDLNAAASSGLPVAFAIESGPAAISGDTVTLTGAGTIIVTASQGGNNNYNAAPDVTGSFTAARAIPVFSNLSGPTITAGTASTALGGTLKAGDLAATGSVMVSLNGTVQSAVVDGYGNFASSFATGGLTASASPYPVDYSYVGDADFEAVQDHSCMLTVTAANGGGGGVNPVGGGGSDGGSSAPVVSLVAVSGFRPGDLLKVDSTGKVLQDVELQSEDGKVTLDIPMNTRMLDSRNQVLTSLTCARIESPPGESSTLKIIGAYDFGPDGAVFQPYLILTVGYDPAALPANVAETSLRLVRWNGSGWEDMERLPDTVHHSISTKISHFSIYGIMVKLAAPAPSPSTAVILGPSPTSSPEPPELPPTPSAAAGTPALTVAPDAGPSGTIANLPAASPITSPENPSARLTLPPWSIMLIFIGTFTFGVSTTIFVLLSPRRNRP